MSGNRHDCSSPIIHQHKICRPHRYILSCQWINCICSGEDPIFFSCFTGSDNLIFLLDLVYKFSNRNFLFCSKGQLDYQWVFWSQHHKCRPIKSVRTSCKNLDDLIFFFYLKINFGAVAFADPIALHCQHLLRPFT